MRMNGKKYLQEPKIWRPVLRHDDGAPAAAVTGPGIRPRRPAREGRGVALPSWTRDAAQDGAGIALA